MRDLYAEAADKGLCGDAADDYVYAHSGARTVTDRRVEAAAQALHAFAHTELVYAKTWEQRSEGQRQAYRQMAKAALDAADGYVHGGEWLR